MSADIFPSDHVFSGLRRNHYGALVLDPPWSFRGYTIQLSNRDVQRHYVTMGLREIMALPVKELAAPDAHLFLWVPGPHLPMAFDLIKAWGFRYSGVAFTWVKLKRSFNARQLRLLPTAEADLHVGLGFTTRKNCELVLLARRGNARRVSKAVREVILAPVREHSRKPDEAYQRVMQYCAGPYCDLFARQSRMGWDTWGDQKELFNREAAA